MCVAPVQLTHSREALVSARQAVLSAVHRLIAVTRFMPAAGEALPVCL